jgi:hypothetical protein
MGDVMRGKATAVWRSTGGAGLSLAAIAASILLGRPSIAQELDLDAIANRSCAVYAAHLVRLRPQEVYEPVSQSEALEVMSITSYLRGAYLAFAPSQSYLEFENEFIRTCLENEVFPATQVVAFFMLRGD